ncbi:DUF7511 domain-containing protein [Natrinema halophilum]|uniref:DUF7511 domain-containing protein n=1 Tax=Natrinema halophilum TaxID=1699371 RepID=UPI001F45B235|nr:hypothetical protein [Natrinema halophilum]UHQ96055.1 hypothetical protein HYG82_20970 [Natrinema halophilum]
MNGSTGGYDDQSTRQRLAAATQYSSDKTDLESVVVRYEDRPNRCTIVPRECPEAERVTTWLTADARAFVDLEDAR